jgi:glycosyltransferase involved in cell wall biosynthesis
MRDAASIAIITPVRNGMPWLAETIASIRAQNYAPLEIAIVDDGSSDDTRDYVRGLMRESNQVRLLEYEGIGRRSSCFWTPTICCRKARWQP